MQSGIYENLVPLSCPTTLRGPSSICCSTIVSLALVRSRAHFQTPSSFSQLHSLHACVCVLAETMQAG